MSHSSYPPRSASISPNFRQTRSHASSCPSAVAPPDQASGRLDGLVAGPCPPDALLGAEVEHPRPIIGFPQPGVAEVELAGLGLALAVILRVHRGEAVAE